MPQPISPQAPDLKLTSQASKVSKRRNGGRKARRFKHLTETHNSTTRSPRKLPTVELFNEDELDILEQQSDWILKEIGIDFQEDTEALDLFHKAGASVSGSRVRFDPGHARFLCTTAPEQFVMHAHDPAMSITIGDGTVALSPGYGSPFVTDLDHGRRYATLEDFQNFIKLTWQTPWLHHSGGTVCEPVDIAVNKRHLHMVYSHLKYSAKPFMGSVTAKDRAEDSIAMAKLVFGERFMNSNCVIQGNINLNSPLVLDQTMAESLKVYARANQCCFISPFLLGGAMGPVTMPALIAQAHAETIAAIALTQLVRKGAPVVYGNFLTNLDMKSGAPVFGAPEANLAILGLGQLSRRMKLPLRGIGHVSASKCADAQAMQESADSMHAAINAGSHVVFHAAGWLEGGLTMGYEKFMLDVDRCGMVCRSVQGLDINDNQLAKNAYQEAGPGENFLSASHTLRNFRTANYESTLLSDTRSFEQWNEAGRPDAEKRANSAYKQALREYQPPVLDPAIDEALLEFINTRTASRPDQWY